MFVRVASFAIAALVIVSSSAVAFRVQSSRLAVAAEAEQTAAPAPHITNTEERALADMHNGTEAFVLSTTRTRTEIRFELPPHTVVSEASLRLAARPQSDATGGLIHVSMNGGEAITIRPQAREMEARFALFSADVRPGENVLEIRYTNEYAAPGWIVDAQRSRLRLTLENQQAIATLDQLERALGADFAAPRRIALSTENTSDRAMLESLVAQGVALRAGRVPLFTSDTERADLVIRIASNHALSGEDRAALRNPDRSQGPEIALLPANPPRLVVTGRNGEEAAAAARLMAARSFNGHGATFQAADAITAARLGRRAVRDAGDVSANANLRTFATSGLPFSADQGARTAVQFSTAGDADRHGALSVLARAALISGEAWLYAWYGDSSAPAPRNHHLLIVGAGSIAIADVERNAPAELRAALRAAERSRGQRGLMRLAAAAYADETVSGDDASTDFTGVGVASVFRDRSQPGRWIGTLTAPDMASFETAGRSLARSNLWTALDGRAAVWSARGVTALDYAVVAPGLFDRAREFAVDHTRDAAFVLFGAALLMLVRGFSRRRRRVRAEA